VPITKISPVVSIFELPKRQEISAVNSTYSQQALPDADSRVEVFCVVDPTNFDVFNICFSFF
jgi:hypothetical protein